MPLAENVTMNISNYLYIDGYTMQYCKEAK